VKQNDLIERQDAIDAVIKYAQFLWDRFHEHCNLAGMIDAINSVPQKKDEWIRAEDQPPPAEVTLLGVNEYGDISTGNASKNGVWYFDNDWMADDEVKYWMTLPKPPEHLIERRKEYERRRSSEDAGFY
jgi:hypothetical protein